MSLSKNFAYTGENASNQIQPDQPSARRILETEGLEALKNAPDGKVQPPHFIAPAVTLYGVVVLMIWVLGVFLRYGFEWARVCITATLVIVAICSVGGLMTEPPTIFVIGTVIGIVLGVAALITLWLPPTTRYLHPRRDSEPAAEVAGSQPR